MVEQRPWLGIWLTICFFSGIRGEAATKRIGNDVLTITNQWIGLVGRFFKTHHGAMPTMVGRFFKTRQQANGLVGWRWLRRSAGRRDDTHWGDWDTRTHILHFRRRIRLCFCGKKNENKSLCACRCEHWVALMFDCKCTLCLCGKAGQRNAWFVIPLFQRNQNKEKIDLERLDAQYCQLFRV